MTEVRLKVRRRAPDAERLAWARQVMDAVGGRVPKTRPEIYAREQIYLAENPEAELKLQAIRIGELGISAIPNEVYGITGLKIRAESPLAHTMNIELANGAEGYIPPPEQHHLGGYTTWEARTAGLDEEAEPRIVETLLTAFEKLAAKPRAVREIAPDAYVRAVLDAKPRAFWRLDERSGEVARDATKNGHDAAYEPGIAFYLPGRNLERLENVEASVNRGVHCARGGRIVAPELGLGDEFSLELWFWNGYPKDGREIEGHVAGIGEKDAIAISGDKLRVGEEVGSGEIGHRTWHHLVIAGNQAYLDGQPDLTAKFATGALWFGGKADGELGLEGKLDDIAVYDRVLSAEEIAAHFQAAQPRIPQETPPLSPEASLRKTHVRAGYRMELVAAEPLVKDPVAIDWGADGRLWVVEMADYPSGMDGEGKPGGRVRVLEDTDEDGRYDRGTVFLDGLNFPNGIKVWRDGALITAAPRILFARDTDGDGRADDIRPLYEGFSEGNQQLRVNGLRWGLDNWIHCASGAHHGGYGEGNAVTSKLTGQKVVLGSRDFRIRPDEGLLDPQSGPSQFGRNRDDWGNWFGVQNSMPLWHYVLRDHHLRRNPHFLAPSPKNLVAPRYSPVFPAKAPQKRFHGFEQSGKFTSACGTIIYRDELLLARGEEGHAFTCEPFHNLVQHNLLQAKGVTFAARRDTADGEIDFVASRDRWFRPVMVRTGPDGALWVVDMYRYMIEHPRWLPKAGQDELRPFYRSGEEFGRIYRVLPANAQPRKWPRLAKASDAELTSNLAHPNGWVRDTAQQLLVQRKASGVADSLRAMVRESATPLGRLHALCTLDGLGASDSATLQTARGDAHPGVRRHAVRLSSSADLAGFSEDSPPVRLQLALALDSGPELAKLAADDDSWIAAAAMTSIDADNVIAALESAAGNPGLFAKFINQAAAWKQGEAATAILARELPDMAASDRMDVVAAWIDATKPATVPQPILSIVETAEKLAFDASAAVNSRISAIQLLGRIPGRNHQPAAKLLAASEPVEIQKAAIARISDVAALLENWANYSPALRTAILNRILTRKPWASAFLDAVDAGKIPKGDLDPSTRQRLETLDAKLKTRVRKLLAASPDRAQAMAQLRPALKLTGDAKQGRVFFEQRCAACHQLAGLGKHIGPDLAAITNKTGEALLESIVDPNAMVEARYALYTATTRDGETFAGMVASETGAQVSLLGADGTKADLLRGDLAELKSAGMSLMPAGLEAGLSPQQFADLIAFIREPE